MWSVVKGVGVLVLVSGVAAGAYATKDRWWPAESAPTDEASDAKESDGQPLDERVILSEQAQGNIGLTARPMRLETYERTIAVPGRVVDKPGVTDRPVASPADAVVVAVHRQTGDVVRPGDRLLTLRLVGEEFQSAQTGLFQSMQKREVTQSEIDRLTGVSERGGIAKSKIIDLQNEQKQIAAAIRSHRHDLSVRGLSAEQVDSIADGTFSSDDAGVAEVSIFVPGHAPDEEPESPGERESKPLIYEVQELHAAIGQRVQPGTELVTLASHQSLWIEGRAFRQEVPLLQKAAEEEWPIRVELRESVEFDWQTPMPMVTVQHIANSLNEDNRTVSFYAPLENQSRTYGRNDRTHLLWRFRPGQRVDLHVQVETWEGVFVMPTVAVVQEGPEFYVFKQNGNFFDRVPIRVLHRDRDHVVIENDGGILPGVWFVQNGAVQLNRVLKSQTNTAPSGVHVHADGSVHADH